MAYMAGVMMNFQQLQQADDITGNSVILRASLDYVFEEAVNTRRIEKSRVICQIKKNTLRLVGNFPVDLQDEGDGNISMRKMIGKEKQVAMK